MSKNAVVLILAVLFMAMLLVVVNQLLYSDSDRQLGMLPGVEQPLVSPPNDSAKLLSGGQTTAGNIESPVPNNANRTAVENNQGANSSGSNVPSSNVPGTKPQIAPQGNVSVSPPPYTPDWIAENPAEPKAATPTPVIAPPADTTDKVEVPKAPPSAPPLAPTEAAESHKPEAVAQEPPAPQAPEAMPNVAPTPTVPVVPTPQLRTGPATIQGVGLHFADSRMVLRVKGDAPFQSRWFTLSEPERLVIDFPENIRNLTAPTVPQNRLVSGARIGRQANGYRLVLDLRGPIKVSGKNDNAGNLEIFLE